MDKKSEFLTANMTIEDYFESLSSKQPIPGGGGAAALSLSFASSLLLMVINLTIDKKNFTDIKDELDKLRSELVLIREYSLKLSDEDAEVFEPLSKAYKNKESNIDDLLINAASVPIKVIETAKKLISMASYISNNCSRLVISDVGVAVKMIYTAIDSALLNIFINTKFLQDKKEAERINRYYIDFVKSLREECELIYNFVYEKLKI